MKRLSVTIFAILSVVCVSAQRKVTSLDGDWNYIVDPYGHGGNGNGSSFAQNWDFDGSRLQDYNFGTSPVLHVPGDWNTQDQKLYYYEGIVWHRRAFNYDGVGVGNRAFLRFEAANYETSVWINGTYLGSHIGGYTPFQFDVTKYLKAGQNYVIARVDNKRRVDGIPTLNTDWWNYGGITRSVNIIEMPETHINRYSVQLSKDMKMIEGWIEVAGQKAGQRVSLEIPELKVKKVFTTDSLGMVNYAFKAKPQLWCSENPKLYKTTVAVGEDKVEDEIGFRTIETKGTQILLNGKPVFLKGVNIHEETVKTNKRASNKEEDDALLEMAKNLGCNFVRLAHYPHNPDMVREAQKMGLMVWSEIPLYWGIDWNDNNVYKNAVNQLTEMIDRDRNCCNIILWSIANETAVNETRTKFLTNLANEARKQDGTRLICAAMQNRETSKNVMEITAPLAEVLDVLSFNEYIGWYDGKAEKCDNITWRFNVEKPVIISEFGAGAAYGRHGSNDEFFSEEYAAKVYEHQLSMLEKIKGLAGTIPWVLKDFRSPHRLIPGVQDDFNRKGLYSDQGEKKMMFEVVKAWYLEK